MTWILCARCDRTDNVADPTPSLCNTCRPPDLDIARSRTTTVRARHDAAVELARTTDTPTLAPLPPGEVRWVTWHGWGRTHAFRDDCLRSLCGIVVTPSGGWAGDHRCKRCLHEVGRIPGRVAALASLTRGWAA